MTDTDTEERGRATLTDMAMRGKDYREDYEFELYGRQVKVQLRPLVDGEFLPLMAEMAEALDVDQEDLQDGDIDEAVERADDEEVSVEEMDEDFVDAMQKAATLGIDAEYDEDGQRRDLSTEEAAELVHALMGGASVELGARVLEVSGDIRDAEKFPEAG